MEAVVGAERFARPAVEGVTVDFGVVEYDKSSL